MCISLFFHLRELFPYYHNWGRKLGALLGNIFPVPCQHVEQDHGIDVIPFVLSKMKVELGATCANCFTPKAQMLLLRSISKYPSKLPQQGNSGKGLFQEVSLWPLACLSTTECTGPIEKFLRNGTPPSPLTFATSYDRRGPASTKGELGWLMYRL